MEISPTPRLSPCFLPGGPWQHPSGIPHVRSCPGRVDPLHSHSSHLLGNLLGSPQTEIQSKLCRLPPNVTCVFLSRIISLRLPSVHWQSSCSSAATRFIPDPALSPLHPLCSLSQVLLLLNLYVAVSFVSFSSWLKCFSLARFLPFTQMRDRLCIVCLPGYRGVLCLHLPVPPEVLDSPAGR